MSIEPLAAFPPESGTNYVETKAQPAPSSPRSESDSKRTPVANPVGTESSPEDPTFRQSPKADESPQDVVELHADSEVKNQLIVEYLNQSGSVILQVPSSEELNVERGIAQELEQAAKLRASESSTPTPSKGDKGHGN